MRLMTFFYLFPILLLVSCGNGASNNDGILSNRPMEFESDSVFLNYIQKQHFLYMWDGAEPHSGMAPERIHMDNIYPENDQNVITIGGSGFGIASILVGIERRFIIREEGFQRLQKIVSFLQKADRFHGMWPHWLYGNTGKVKPFGIKDNGGDLVESAFLIQGLLCVRQYFKDGTEEEKKLAKQIDTLWRDMEWNWYTQGDKNVLYWHWSPNYKWEMNFALEGYNECLISYILASSSPTFPIANADPYYKGWERNGKMLSSNKFMGYDMLVNFNGAENTTGPLFWAHYSFIGFNPYQLQDQLGLDYWKVNVNQSFINHAYCESNPRGYKGYSDSCWGLTASYSVKGYDAHAPNNDLGVITPTAALSSFPYTPDNAMKALKYFYFTLGDKIWGKYGFYDAFSIQDNWYPNRYLAIDQCTIAPMIENYRTGLLWNLFMSCPEVQAGIQKLGFKNIKY